MYQESDRNNFIFKDAGCCCLNCGFLSVRAHIRDKGKIDDSLDTQQRDSILKDFTNNPSSVQTLINLARENLTTEVRCYKSLWGKGPCWNIGESFSDYSTPLKAEILEKHREECPFFCTYEEGMTAVGCEEIEKRQREHILFMTTLLQQEEHFRNSLGESKKSNETSRKIGKATVAVAVISAFLAIVSTYYNVKNSAASVNLQNQMLTLERDKFLHELVLNNGQDTDRILNEISCQIKYTSSDEERVKLLLSRSEVHIKTGAFEKAIDDYSAIISNSQASDRQKAKTLYERGGLYYKVGYYREAANDFLDFLKMNYSTSDQSVTSYCRIAEYMLCIKEYDRAIRLFSDILAKKNIPHDIRVSSLFGRSIAYVAIGEINNVFKDYSTLLNLKDLNSSTREYVLLERGKIYGKQGKLNEAITDFSDIIQMEQASPRMKRWSLYNRGLTYFWIGNFNDAVLDYSSILKSPDVSNEEKSSTYLNRGVAYERMKKFDLAINDFTSTINLGEIDIDNLVQAFMNRSLVYSKVGKKDEAISDLSTIINSRVSNEQKRSAILARGKTYEQFGDDENALGDYNSLIKDLNIVADLKSELLLTRARLYQKANQIEKAKTDCKTVLDMPHIKFLMKIEASDLLKKLQKSK